MAKRFIDTNIFKKNFVKGLETPYKLLWIYILQDCDHAGVWEVDIEVAEIRVGQKISKELALKKFEGKIHELNGGSKWFIPDFISFQYGILNPENRAHNSVISILKKENLLNEDLTIKELSKPLVSSLVGAMVKDKDKEMVKDMELVMGKVETQKQKAQLVFPYVSENFMRAWNILAKEKKWRNKSIHALQAALKKLSKYSEDDAIEMINESIAGEWQGIFELKNSKHGNNGSKQESKPWRKGFEFDRIADQLRREATNSNTKPS